jgi:hypothetical protein
VRGCIGAFKNFRASNASAFVDGHEQIAWASVTGDVVGLRGGGDEASERFIPGIEYGSDARTFCGKARGVWKELLRRL